MTSHLRRLNTVVLATMMLVTGFAAGVRAADGCDPKNADTGDQYVADCPGEERRGGSGGTGNDSDPRDAGPVYRIARTEVDGEYCWMIATGGSNSWDEMVELLEDFDDPDIYRACQFEAGTPPSVFTFWMGELCPPQPPTPVRLDPQNTAITGKPGYLTIGGDRTEAIECLGQIVNAEARYVIDWGDGATTETTSQGGEWPDGDLTHVYEDKGSHTITVEAYWTGTVGGVALPELPVPTSATVEVQVDEVQAVVTEQH